MTRILGLAVALLGCADLEPRVGAESTPAIASEAGTVVFARDLRPSLSGCLRCHDPGASSHIGYDMGGLDLTTLKGLRRGGFTSGGNIVVPFDPEGSALVQKLRGTYAYGARMPKDGPPFMSDDAIAKVAEWIAEGALGEDDE
ncbi:MAG: c-type cytochrome domain-containing protein [Polyangiales bacterium]